MVGGVMLVALPAVAVAYLAVVAIAQAARYWWIVPVLALLRRGK